MQESRTVEFKLQPNESYLKTVSAFANGPGGTIYFGIADNGDVAGLDNPSDQALAIENAVNDAIDPRPDYTINQNADGTLSLNVAAGRDKPYLYRSKAYVRHGSSTVPADRSELRHLSIEGSGLSYDELPVPDTDLEFTALERLLQDTMGLERLSKDALVSLNLIGKDGRYTMTARILADKNGMLAEGTDIMRIDEESGALLDRERVAGVSAIVQYQTALSLFERYYQYEIIEGGYRVVKERIPFEAYREAVANTLAHRAWDARCCVRIALYEDRIELFCPGGLTDGMTQELYFANLPGKLRNPTLAYILLRARIIENIGSGVGRILSLYEGAPRQPRFEFGDDYIVVTLPVTDAKLDLSPDQEDVFSRLSKTRPAGRSEILASVTFGKDKTVQILNELIAFGVVKKEGAGRGTKYRAL